MTLPVSGAIEMAQINSELGITTSNPISLNDSSVRSLLGKSSGAISLSDSFGKGTPMTVSIGVTSQQAGNVLVSSINVSYPVGPIVSGDILVIFANNGTGFGALAGWTAVSTGVNAVYYKTAIGGESGKVTIPFTSQHTWWNAQMLLIKGSGTKAYVAIDTSPSGTNPSTVIYTAPVVAGAWPEYVTIVKFWELYSSRTWNTPPAGFTQLGSNSLTSSWLGYKLQNSGNITMAASGNTDGKAITFTGF